MSLLETEKKAEERAKASFNERAKLSATYLNGIAVALVALGYIAPVLSYRGKDPPLDLAVTGGLCVTISVALHLGARWLLKRLR